MNCRTCIHWHPPIPHANHGRCNNLTDHVWADPRRPGSLLTAPTFGCNQHTPLTRIPTPKAWIEPDTLVTLSGR